MKLKKWFYNTMNLMNLWFQFFRWLFTTFFDKFLKLSNYVIRLLKLIRYIMILCSLVQSEIICICNIFLNEKGILYNQKHIFWKTYEINQFFQIKIHLCRSWRINFETFPRTFSRWHSKRAQIMKAKKIGALMKIRAARVTLEIFKKLK